MVIHEIRFFLQTDNPPLILHLNWITNKDIKIYAPLKNVEIMQNKQVTDNLSNYVSNMKDSIFQQPAEL